MICYNKVADERTGKGVCMQFIERLRLEKVKKRFTGIVLFGAWYLITFFWMEQRKVPIHIIHMSIDRKIPFCEYFIIPYLLWFLFVVGTVLYFVLFVDDDREYYKLVMTLAVGMVMFVIISYVYPNGHTLRPRLRGDSIFIQMVRILYRIDTPTNILPSLHVFNAVACTVALLKNDRMKQHCFLCLLTVVLTVLIILSTVFLKQHSMVDVMVAIIMNLVCYGVIYVKEEARRTQRLWVREKL